MKKFYFLIAGLLLFNSGFAQRSWQVIGTEGFTSAYAYYTSIAITSDGTPYAAFKGPETDYKAAVMMFDGTDWVFVGPAGFSDGTSRKLSIDIDGYDSVYIAFKDHANEYKATVMKFNGTDDWVLVGSKGFSTAIGEEIIMALAPDGTPYVCYIDESNSNKVTVMGFDGTSWMVVGMAGLSGGSVSSLSLDFDEYGTPFIAFCENPSYTAKVMKFDGSGWVSVGTAVSPGSAYYTSIVVDENNIPYLAYTDGLNGDKSVVKKFDGSTWQLVGTDGFSESGVEDLNLAVDKNNMPYVAFKDILNGGKATVMGFDGSAWNVVVAPGFSADVVKYLSFAVDHNTLWVGYNDAAYSGRMTVMYSLCPEIIINQSAGICDGDSIFLENAWRKTAGIYYDTLTSVEGCDSIIITTLTVNTVDVSVTVLEDTLMANATGATYQWIDCSSNMPIDGATDQKFRPESSGEYAVIVTQGNCAGISDCYTVTITGIFTSHLGTQLKLYPVPARDHLTVDLGGHYEYIEISMSNINGQLIFRKDFRNQQIINFDMNEFRTGIYFLRLRSKHETATYRIVKE